MHFMERKRLANQVKMVEPHPFWEEQPVWKMFSETPKRDGPI
jgi:hypothetical protein